MKITVDGKSSSLVNAVPESLSEGILKHDDVIRKGITSYRVDLLAQKVENSECSFWKIDMNVPVAVALKLEFGEVNNLLFFNIGESVRVQFWPGEVFCFDPGHQKTVQLPKSEISLFAGTSKIRHEMVLLDLTNVDQIKAGNAMLNALFGKWFKW